MFCPRFKPAPSLVSHLCGSGWLYAVASCAALVIALAASPMPGAWADATATASNDLVVESSFPDTPPVPVVASLRSDGFDLTDQANVEYSLDGGAWTASGSFSGLAAGSTHSIVARWTLTHAESAAVQVVLPTQGGGGEPGGGVQPGGSGSGVSDDSGVSPLPTGPGSLAVTSDDGGGLPLAVAVAGAALAVAVAAAVVRFRRKQDRRAVCRSIGNHGHRRSGVRPHLRASTRSKHRARIGTASARRTRAGLARSGVLAGACFLALLALSGVPALSLAVSGGTEAVSSDSAAAGDQTAASASASAGESGMAGSDAAGSAAATEKPAVTASSRGDSAAAASESSPTVQAQSSDSALVFTQDESANELTPQEASVVAFGSFSTCPTSTWMVLSDGRLAFSGSGTVTNSYGDRGTPWYPYASQITSVVFTGTTSFTNMEYWFAELTNLTTVTFPDGFGKDTTSMGGMFGGCSALTSVSFPAGCGANVGSTAYMFNEDHALQSVTMPADFAKSATYMSYMFCGCSSMSSMTLPSGFGLSAVLVDGMFYGCYGMTYLDMSATSIPAVTKMDAMFLYCTALSQVKLGPNWSFKGAGSTVLCQLPDPTAPYSLWRAVGTGSVSNPNGSIYNATDLAANYTSAMADTYVRAGVLSGTATVSKEAVSASGPVAASLSGFPADATLSYVWYAADDDTSVGTQISVKPKFSLISTAYLGKKIYCVLTDSSGKYIGSVSSNREIRTTDLTGYLIVTGTYSPGSTLSVSLKTGWSGVKSLFTWYVAPDGTSDGVAVGTGDSFTIPDSDLGKYIYATAVDTSGVYTGTLTSSRSVVWIPFTGSVSSSGIYTVGSTLTATSTGTPPDANVVYTWHSAADVASAGDSVFTGPSYVIQPSDLNRYVYVTISDSSGKYSGSKQYRKNIKVLAGMEGSVSVSGTSAIGCTLTATASGFPADATPVFTWYVSGSPTGDGTQVGTGKTYAPGGDTVAGKTFSDFGQYLYVVVTDGSGTYGNSISSSRSVVSETGSLGQNAFWTFTPDGTITFGGSGMVTASFGTGTLPWLPYCNKITSAVFTGTASYTHLNFWFANCINLKSVSMPEGFGQDTINVQCMFMNCRSLISLSFPDGFAKNTLFMSNMFDGCSSLKQVRLGTGFPFKGKYSTPQVKLPDPPSPYVSWRAVGSGTASAPAGTAYTADSLASSYADSMADTYVWSAALPGTVTVDGSFAPNATLTAVPSSVPSDATLSYAWYKASDADSEGSQIFTGQTYTPSAADLGSYLHVVASDTSGKYMGSLYSAHSEVKEALVGTVTLSCAPMIGVPVTATLNTQQAGAAASFNWYTAADDTSDGTLVGGGPTYTPVAGDYGKYLYAVATDSSGTYGGSIASGRAQVNAVLSVTVPTAMALYLASDGTLSGPDVQATNESPMSIHADSLKTTVPASPFLLSSASSFDTASGCNVMNLSLVPGSGTAVDLASYTTPAQLTAGQWNMSASGGTLPLTLSGKMKNINAAVVGKESLHALDISWSFAAGSL